MIGIYSVPSKTSRALAQQLNIPLYYQKDMPLKTIINWGKTSNTLDALQIINHPHAVYKASNKQLCRFILEKAGIPVPKNGIETFPVVGRPIKHSQGRKFFYCESLDDVTKACKNGAVYFSSYFPKVKEYRVHATPKTIIAVAEKIDGDYASPVWNHSNDFYFKYIKRLDCPGSVRTIARHAVSTLGLHFGACDIGVNEEGEIKVFEINCAPALSNYALTKYVNFFQELLYEPEDDEYEEDNFLD